METRHFAGLRNPIHGDKRKNRIQRGSGISGTCWVSHFPYLSKIGTVSGTTNRERLKTHHWQTFRKKTATHEKPSLVLLTFETFYLLQANAQTKVRFCSGRWDSWCHLDCRDQETGNHKMLQLQLNSQRFLNQPIIHYFSVMTIISFLISVSVCERFLASAISVISFWVSIRWNKRIFFLVVDLFPGVFFHF